MAMTHKERALCAFAFEEGDRVPLDIGGLNVTSFHARAEPRLKAALGLPPSEPVIGSFNQQAVIVDERILQHFDADFRVLYPRDGNQWATGVDGLVRDEYGIGYRQSPDGLYYDFAHHPLAEADLKAIEAYTFASPTAEHRVAGLAERIARYGGEYALVLEGSRDSVFGISSWLRGLEQFFMDLADDSPLAEALMDRVLQQQIDVFDFILGRFGKDIDIVRIGDDLGSQLGLLISPATYRAKVKPRHEKLVRAIKSRAECKVVIHSCGAIREILPDFIDIGIDGVNPVQTTSAGMDPAGLKRDFGRHLVFWGGGVDTQQVLCKATPETVARVVRETVRTFKPGGGYIFAQVHNIQPDVPTENILAMYQAFHAHARYICPGSGVQSPESGAPPLPLGDNTPALLIRDTTTPAYTESRAFAGLPSIAKTGERLWAGWQTVVGVAGATGFWPGEEPGSFFILTYSDDDGATWCEHLFVAHPLPATHRTAHPTLCVDEHGTLWVYYHSTHYGIFDSTMCSTWAITCPNPTDHPHRLTWSAPVKMHYGYWTSPPTIIDGQITHVTSLDRVREWNPNSTSSAELDPSLVSSVGVRFLRREGWAMRQTGFFRAAMDYPQTDYFEPTCAQADDGSLLLIYRRAAGTFFTRSRDGGRTWDIPENIDTLDGIAASVNSRSCQTRTPGGRLCLVFNDSRKREKLTLALSEDGGYTWPRAVVLDDREGEDISYPFAVHDGDAIYVVWDRGRLTTREILCARLSESAVVAGTQRVTRRQVSGAGISPE